MTRINKLLSLRLDDLTGQNACPSLGFTLFSACAALSLLASMVIRSRHVIFFKHYETRKTPVKYAFITKVPYEALAMAVIVAPRVAWLARFVVSGVTDNTLADALRPNAIGYSLIAWFLMCEVIERRSFRKYLWSPYWERKQRLLTARATPSAEKESLSEPLLESIPQDPQAVAPENESLLNLTFSQRVKGWFKTPTLPEPTANDVLCRMHWHTFINVMLVFVFTTNVSTAACATDPSEWFEELPSVLPAMTLAVALSSLKFVEMFSRSWRFARTEMSWE